MKTLVIYDISDDHDRLWLSEVLLDLGLERIQYSCFLGRLDGGERSILEQQVAGVIDLESDSVYIVPLCERCLGLMKRVSRCTREVDEDEIIVL